MTQVAAYMPSHDWELVPYSDLSNAFVFTTQPPGVRVISRYAMLALRLSTAYQPEEAAGRFASIVRHPQGVDGARPLYNATVADLCTEGIIVTASQPATQNGGTDNE